MSELLPFDINEYRADPSRLRNSAGERAHRSSPVWGECLAVHWADERAVLYHPHEIPVCLRLAPPKPVTARVRMARDMLGAAGRPIALQDGDGLDLCQPDPARFRAFEWASDPVEIELYPRVSK